MYGEECTYHLLYSRNNNIVDHYFKKLENSRPEHHVSLLNIHSSPPLSLLLVAQSYPPVSLSGGTRPDLPETPLYASSIYLVTIYEEATLTLSHKGQEVKRMGHELAIMAFFCWQCPRGVS